MQEERAKQIADELAGALGDDYAVFPFSANEVCFRQNESGHAGRIWLDNGQWLLGLALTITLLDAEFDIHGKDVVEERCIEQASGTFRLWWEEHGYALSDDHDWGSGWVQDGGPSKVAIYETELVKELAGPLAAVTELRKVEEIPCRDEWLEGD